MATAQHAGARGWVSVIVPTRNRAELLRAGLEALLAQRYRPLEIVVCDDGSEDGTAEVVAAFRRAHGGPALQVRAVRHERARGAAAARNSGLRASQGEFVQFLDDDDRLDPRKIELQVQALQQSSGLDYVYGLTRQVTEGGELLALVGRPFDPAGRLRNIPVHHWHTSGALYRRWLCLAAGPWAEELEASEDWEYAARIKSISQRAAFLPEALSFYVIHAHGQMIGNRGQRTLLARRKAIERVLELLRGDCADARRAREVCARALVLNALEWAALGAEGPMRQDLRAAARQGGQVCRAAAALLWLGARALAPQHVAAAVWALRRWRARQTLRVPAPEVRGGAGRC